MRKLFFAVALLLAIMFLIGQMAEMQAIAETLQRGDWRFLLLALVVESIWLFNIAASYRVIFRATGLQETLRKLVLMAAAANFVNVVAPSAGVGGMAVFVSEAQRRGYSSGRVTVAGVLYVLFDYAGFLCLLVAGLVVLFRRNNLNPAELLASGLVVLIAAGMSFFLYLGVRSATALGRTLAWMALQINRVARLFSTRKYFSERRAYRFALEAADALHDVRRKPGNLIPPLLLAFSSKILLLLILLLMFLAFKIPFSPGTLVAGFSIGYLFLVVSPTPAGIGVVEGALTLALSSLRVPLGAAAIIALSYRGITFWAPLLIGLFAFRILSHGDFTTGEELEKEQARR